MNEKFYQLPCGRREKIIRSAYQVFSRNEYKRASMSAIADAAGISKSLLFYYFKNKKELYLYLVCHAENLTRSAVQDYGVWETEDLFEMLRRNVRAKCSLSVKYPEICMFSVKAYYEQHPEVKKDVHKLIAKTNQNAEQIFFRKIIYGAIPTPLVSTLSLSVFFSLSGALTIFALSEFTETRESC